MRFRCFAIQTPCRQYNGQSQRHKNFTDIPSFLFVVFHRDIRRAPSRSSFFSGDRPVPVYSLWGQRHIPYDLLLQRRPLRPAPSCSVPSFRDKVLYKLTSFSQRGIHCLHDRPIRRESQLFHDYVKPLVYRSRLLPPEIQCQDELIRNPQPLSPDDLSTCTKADRDRAGSKHLTMCRACLGLPSFGVPRRGSLRARV